MNIKTVVFLAMMGGAIPVSAASAMTVAGPNGASMASPALQLVDYKVVKKKIYHKRRPHYTPGGHYNSAPKNWRHHYNKRPGDWRTRGCVSVGPIWWCP